MEGILNMRQLHEYLPEKPGPETIRKWVREKRIPCLPRASRGRIFFNLKVVDFWVKNGRPAQDNMTDKEYSNLGLEDLK